NAKLPRPRWATLAILAGVLLMFFPPTQQIKIPWEAILGAGIPLLLWQNVRRILNADWRGWSSTFLWGVTTLSFSLVLRLIGTLNWSSALLFGVIVASMIWRTGEPDDAASYMSQAGTLTLIFLLTEAEIAIQAPNYYLGGIFSGAFFGVSTALFGSYLLKKLSAKLYPWLGLGQVYAAYWLSSFAGASAVTAALVSVMTFVWLEQSSQAGFREKEMSAPLNSWIGFSSALALFVLLGWQAHQPVSVFLLTEVLIGTLLGLAITWIGRKWNVAAFYKEREYWMSGTKIALLLLPSLVLWPRNTIYDPVQIAVAIGIAVFVIAFSHVGLSHYFPRETYSKDIS
ncbi:MAG: hypothetical protein L3J16_05400, partial [Anaerolineales bacterium]|nr:hypothetical protein [Anaerolineales bacterium]